MRVAVLIMERFNSCSKRLQQSEVAGWPSEHNQPFRGGPFTPFTNIAHLLQEFTTHQNTLLELGLRSNFQSIDCFSPQKFLPLGLKLACGGLILRFLFGMCPKWT